MAEQSSKIIVFCMDLASMRAIHGALSKSCELVWVREAKGLCRVAGDEPAAEAVIVDNAIPQVNAIEALNGVKAARSSVRRILLTDYCDLGIIVQGLHTGAVQNIVYKPVNAAELIGSVGVQTRADAHAPAAMNHPVRAAG